MQMYSQLVMESSNYKILFMLFSVDLKKNVLLGFLQKGARHGEVVI
jgi:hypothetical protein